MRIGYWTFCDDCGRTLTVFEKENGCAYCAEQFKKKEQEMEE